MYVCMYVCMYGKSRGCGGEREGREREGGEREEGRGIMWLPCLLGEVVGRFFCMYL